MWSLDYGMRSQCLDDAGLSSSPPSLCLFSLQSSLSSRHITHWPSLKRKRSMYIRPMCWRTFCNTREDQEWLWLHFTPVSYPSLKFAIEHIFNLNNIIILIMKDTAVPFKSSPVLKCGWPWDFYALCSHWYLILSSSLSPRPVLHLASFISLYLFISFYLACSLVAVVYEDWEDLPLRYQHSRYMDITGQCS